jgi:hypothetical protein
LFGAHRGPGTREEDDDTVKQVKDAVEYVMSPSGASLRVTLVRDFLDAMDAYLEVLEESGGSGGGGGSEGELFLGAEDLEKLAETGRSVYLRAPEAWAPVVVNVVAREGGVRDGGARGAGRERARDEGQREEGGETCCRPFVWLRAVRRMISRC